MKIKLFFILIILSTYYSKAQTNGWHQYAKPLHVNQMVKDASGNYHYATNIGYQKLDINFNTVDIINLTTQETPVGNCFSVAVNPNNENQIALGENNRVFIFTNGSLTDQIAINPSSQFTGPSLYYNNTNILYIFDSNTEGYKTFQNHTITEVSTPGIRPQDIVENKDGTKVYLAGVNNGLWEYTRATNTWVNFTAENSNLINNSITDLYVDTNDNLFVASYGGINKVEPNENINACVPTDYSPVFELDIHPTTGEILVRTSQPNSINNLGFATVDFDTCTWTYYTNDDASCIEENTYKTVQYSSTPSDGNIICSEALLSAENTFTFDPSNLENSCSQINLDYNDIGVRVNSDYIIDVETRERSDGKIDIAMCDGSTNTYYISIEPDTFDGDFPAKKTITSNTNENFFSIVSDNTYFIVETDEGRTFIDEDDNHVDYNHNIPDNLSISSKKTTVVDSDNGIINILHKSFDASFNYHVYKTQCDTETGTCLQPEEIFTNNRDISQDINFGVFEDNTSDKVHAVAVKTDSSGAIRRTKENWDRSSNTTSTLTWDELHPVYPILDVIVIAASIIIQKVVSLYVPDKNTLQVRTEHPTTGTPVVTDVKIDADNDGNNDEILSVSKFELTDNETNVFVKALLLIGTGNSGGFTDAISARITEIESIDAVGVPTVSFKEILDSELRGIPKDFIVTQFEIKQYSPTEAMILLLTNYGLLIKTAIDISNLTLSREDIVYNNSISILYPNPASDLISFSNKTINNIEVFDSNGRKVLKANSNTLSVKNLTNGIYIVKGRVNNNNVISQKLIKK